jgi:hypothetical protein
MKENSNTERLDYPFAVLSDDRVYLIHSNGNVESVEEHSIPSHPNTHQIRNYPIWGQIEEL